MSLKRVGFQLEEELIKKIDDYAKGMHVNRTAGLSIIVSQFFLQQETLNTLKIISEQMEKQRTAADQDADKL